MKRVLRNMIIAIVLLPILFWVLSLGKCEILTLMYGKQFIGQERQTNLLAESDYLKVLKYSNSRAEVYYVIEDHGYGNVLTFNKVDGYWDLESYNTIWSSSGGSASGVIWPYWWHFIYGGF